MGNTEWGLLVRSDDDVRYWLQVAKEHNTCENEDEVGEELTVTAVLNYRSPKLRHCFERCQAQGADRQVPAVDEHGRPNADHELPAKEEETRRRHPWAGQQAQQLAGLPGHGLVERGEGARF